MTVKTLLTHHARTALRLILWLLLPGSLHAATITVENTVAGTTPPVLGYNLGHFMVGSNTADWWRYSGVKAARVFISPSEIESSDDIDGIGDGVSSQTTFNSRRQALRANAADPGQALDNSYINWDVFNAGYASISSGNRYSVTGTFPILRSLGVEILANITASPRRLPVANNTDWANIWELWQHYYAQAFYLSKNYDVRRFSMFNEPNGWTPAISIEDWHLRLQICSDALRAGVADANARHGKNLVPQILAPNTSNGSNKYDNAVDYWGKHAVTNRHLKFDGTTDLNWWNFDVYNFQKYSMLTNDIGTSSGYIDDINLLRSKIAADMPGETPFPLALTEYNVRTGSSYETIRETLDTPSDFVALAANSIALAERRVSQLYLYKFSQTGRTTGYLVAKNASHYVNNSTSGTNNIGGITKGGEAYRLFCKAAGTGRNRYAFTSNAGSNVWAMATRDPAANVHYVYIANKNTTAVSLDVSVSALGVVDGSFVTVEQVSGNGGLGGGTDQKATSGHGGAVSRYTAIASGKVPAANIPGQSVWLVSIYAGVQGSPQIIEASADTVLGDGTAKNTTGGSATQLTVRSNGTANNRRVTLFKFALPSFQAANLQNVLLTFNAGTLATSNPVQVHVYGLSDDSWSENAATWASLTSALKQNVADGNKIDNNIVANLGTTAKILGQVWVNASTNAERAIDVSDFVRGQSDGTVSFLVVQDHRWDNTLDSTTIQTVGDTQLDGMKIASREDGVNAGPRLRLFTLNTVTYDGNGSTGGDVPVDTNSYSSGATATVLGNTGSLVKTGYNFTGWNTQADGLGTTYAPATTFNITAGTTLFAKWAPSVYQNWSGGVLPSLDTNNDGITNGIAWLLGASNPSVNATSLLPTFDGTTDADYFIFTFRRRDAANNDSATTIVVQYGSTLVGWNPAVHDGSNIIITPTNNFYSAGVAKVQVKIKKNLAIGGKLFSRISLQTN